MLNFIYYPVSWILWFWHKVFGAIPFLGPDSGIAWALAVMFLVFTLRALLYKPFVGQVRSMRKMQEFAPEIQKLKKKYGSDKQRMAAEMQKLQSQHGVNPLGGCLPILVQIPVFIGLFQVLKEFKPGKTENYGFGAAEVQSFLDADLFGAKLGAAIFPLQGGLPLEAYGTTLGQMLVVMIPLMIIAGVLTHITARHSVARQTEAQAATQQTAIMNKLMLYLFPIGVVVGAPFLPLAILLYWVANNLWTLFQQSVVYRRIEREEAEKKQKAVEQRNARAPRPGQKPNRAARAAAARDSDGAEDGSASDRPDASDAEASPNGAANDGAAGTQRPTRTSGTSKSGNRARSNGTPRGANRAANVPGTSSSRTAKAGGAGKPTGGAKPTSGAKPTGGSRQGTGGKPAGGGAGNANNASTDGTGSGKPPARRPTTVKKGRKRR